MHHLEQFEMKEIEKVKRRQQYYIRALEDFTRRELEGSNKKSIKLPNGTLAIKKQQPHYEYADEQFIEWAESYFPELIKVTIPEPKKTIDKKELKKRSFIDDGMLFIDGLEVQGVSVEEREEKFEVK